jgi:hypothetical protein
MADAACVANSTISWKDAAVPAAIAELRKVHDGEEVLEGIACEYLVASFLADSEFDVERAIPKLRQTVEWRKNSGANAIREGLMKSRPLADDLVHMSTVKKHMPLVEGGLCIEKRGLPYAIRYYGLADANALREVLTESEILEWHISLSEWRLMQLEDYAIKSGEFGDIVLVQDVTCPIGILKQWRTQNPMAFFKEASQIMADHYPLMTGAILICFAPWAFQSVLSLLRPVLPAYVSQRIQVIQANEVPSVLGEYIEPCNRPECLGGEIPDEELVPFRPAVQCAPLGIELFVDAGKIKEIALALDTGEIATYGFCVSGGYQADIMFSCFFEPIREGCDENTEVERIEVCAPERVVSDSGGSSFVAPERGNFVLAFDNSFSWVNGKTVTYELAQLED